MISTTPMALMAVLALVCPAQAQERELTAAEQKPVIRVVIECTNPGTKAPRDPSQLDGTDRAPYRLEGRAVRWQVEGKFLEDSAALLSELTRIHDTKSFWITDANSELLYPRPVVILTGGPVCYDDFIRTFDAVTEAGLDALHAAQLEPPRPALVPKEFPATADLDGIVLPAGEYHEPAPETGWHPTLDVLQDGRIRTGDEVLFDPEKDGADYGAVRKQLLQWKADARRRGLTGSVGEQDPQLEFVNDAWILVRADKWTEWRLIRLVIEQCMEPDVLFWKIGLGVVSKR